MPATALVLPPQPVPVIDAGGLVSLPWRSSLQNALNNLQAQITALAALEGDTTALETALAALQGEVDAAEASIAAHIADTANPHATTAAQVGADPVGTATAAVAAHVALADPHTQYLTEAAATAGYQPLDATLTALSGANWALNALPIGTGADTVSQVAFAANTFPARASTGNLVAKAITDGALSALAGSGGTAGFLRGDGTVSGTITSTMQATDFVASKGTVGTQQIMQTWEHTDGVDRMYGVLEGDGGYSIYLRTAAGAEAPNAYNKFVITLDAYQFVSSSFGVFWNGIRLQDVYGAWQTPTLLNGFANLGSPFNSAGYRKSSNRAELRGVVASASHSATPVIFTLPVGFRPANRLVFPAFGAFGAGDVCGRVDVFSNGDVQIIIPATTVTGYVSLDGISFEI